MSTEDNKNLVRRYMEVDVNEANIEAANELVTRDFLFHFPGSPAPMDRAGLAQTTLLFHAGFPDQHTTVDDILAEGDKVAARFTFRGTQTGAFQGIPPTGKAVTMNGMAIWRIADGKIAEHWVLFDALGMMQQLGVIPAPS
jgi:steroid delta-isomerase-like uncharacterized protein